MATRTILIPVLLISTLTAGTAAAEYSGRETHDHTFHTRAADNYSDYARVVRVEPLTRTVEVSTPVQHCWNEEVVHRDVGHRHHRGRSFTSPIVGGIVGGLVGNQFGGGTGKTLLTVAGAVLGASVGNDVGNRHYRRHYHAPTAYTTTERRCNTSHSVRHERRTDGYLVDYEYNGRIYSTRLDYDPGDRIRVDVKVVPGH